GSWSIYVQAYCSPVHPTYLSSDLYSIDDFGVNGPPPDVHNTISCPLGQYIVGGGGEITGSLANVALTSDRANRFAFNAWTVMVNAVCARSAASWGLQTEVIGWIGPEVLFGGGGVEVMAMETSSNVGFPTIAISPGAEITASVFFDNFDPPETRANRALT